MRAIPAILLMALTLGCGVPAAPPTVPTAPAASAPGASPPSASQVAAPPAPSPATGAAPVQVRVGANVGASDAAILIGMDNGFFAEQGMEVEIVRGSGSDHIAAVATGDLEVVGGALNAGLLNAIGRDLPIRIVADKGSTPPGFAYTTMALRRDLWDSGQVRTWADLKGRRVAAASVRSSVDFLLARGLAEAGLTLNDIDLMQLAYPEMNAAFANGVIDVASFWEPLLTVGMDQGFVVRWKDADEIDPGHQSGVILYGVSFLQQTPELGRRFLLAYVKAARLYNDAFRKGVSRDEVVNAIARHTNTRPELVARTVPVGLNPDGCANAADLADQLAWFHEQGYLQRELALGGVVDETFCNHAVQQLGRYTY